jgi:hypothetical protein
MRLLSLSAFIIAVAALGVALFAVVIGEEDSRTFDAVIVADHEEDEFESDLGERGDSPGDLFGRVRQLQRDSESSGTHLSLCTRTTGSEEDSTFACTTTLEFEEGSIIAEGIFDVALRDEAQELAILGGTGDYGGARGTVSVTAQGEDRYLVSVDAKTED